MARPSKNRVLSVWMNGERVGTWSTHAGRADEFRYVREWLDSEHARPISLSLPLRPTPYKGDTVAAYFDNLLPDSKAIRERLQRRFDTASTKAFDLLAEIGRDCVGALQLLPEDAPPPNVRELRGERITASEVEGILLRMLGTPLGHSDESEDFRISVAGAQEKTALLRQGKNWMRPLGTTPSTHILKLPIGTGGNGIDLTTSVENEWLCAQILQAYGLPVANCWMDRFGEQKVLVVERFDRKLAADKSWIIRLPQEDLCQATGTAGDRKYEAEGGPGIRAIMNLLLGSSMAEQDRLDFFRTQLLFWMLCAIDGHAKNFSLFLDGGGEYRLTPRYDVLSAHPVLGTSRGKLSPHKVKMAMAVEGSSRHYLWRSILPRHWEEMARRCGVGTAFRDIAGQLATMTPKVIDSVNAKLPEDFPESVAEPVFNGLRQAAGKLAAAHTWRS